MKAIRCKEFGPPSALVLEEMPGLKPKAKEVVVQVKACGINFPDTLIIQGLYQFKPELPFTPGSDIAGVVKEIGDKVKHLAVGDEVFGFVFSGGFAEEVVVPSNTCFLKSKKNGFPNCGFFYGGIWDLISCAERQGEAGKRRDITCAWRLRRCWFGSGGIR